MSEDKKVVIFENLSKEDKMKFNLQLGEAVMKDYKEMQANLPPPKPCEQGHNPDEWYCVGSFHMKRLKEIEL